MQASHMQSPPGASIDGTSTGHKLVPKRPITFHFGAPYSPGQLSPVELLSSGRWLLDVTGWTGHPSAERARLTANQDQHYQKTQENDISQQKCRRIATLLAGSYSTLWLVQSIDQLPPGPYYDIVSYLQVIAC